MDAVILAAGKGERLNGYAAPYHKPLVLVNGVPLIAQCVEHAKSVLGANDRIVVVAAPANVGPICSILEARNLFLDDRLRIVVQPIPTGPGAALVLGLEALSELDPERVLVLMGDNSTPHADVEKIVAESEARRDDVIVGVRYVDTEEEAERFTRILLNHKAAEGTPINVVDDRWQNGYKVWCGPLVIPDPAMARIELVSPRAVSGQEFKIGRVLHKLSTNNCVIDVTVDTLDIGIPEVLT